jgi:hypothetical protein
VWLRLRRAGRREEAEKLAAAVAPNAFSQALIYAGLGDKDRTLEALDRVSGLGAGLSIAATLGRDTIRYQFTEPPEIIDLGLRLADVRQHALQTEPVVYPPKADPRENLRDNGATDEEVRFLADLLMLAGLSTEVRTRACASCGHFTNVHMLCDHCEEHICDNCDHGIRDKHFCSEECLGFVDLAHSRAKLTTAPLARPFLWRSLEGKWCNCAADRTHAVQLEI